MNSAREMLVEAWHFVLHISIGTLVFVIIIFAAVGLDLLAVLLREWNVKPFIVEGVEWMEIFIFGLDLLTYVVFLLIGAWRSPRAYPFLSKGSLALARSSASRLMHCPSRWRRIGERSRLPAC